MIGMAEFTDISGFFANSAEMISECKGTVYGYLRVSTAAQKHDRQMDAMRELGVEKEHMFFDKKSGKDFNRPGYQELLAKLKEGDLVVIKNIDRLGRNTKEVKEQWRIITQEKHVSIVVIDTPILNAGKELGPLGQALSDIIFAIFSMVADFDRQSIYQRLKEGLRVAMRERGVKPGRKAKAIPEGFDEVKEAYEKGEVSQRAAASRLGVDRKTFRKWLNGTKIREKETGGQEQKSEDSKRNARCEEDFKENGAVGGGKVNLKEKIVEENMSKEDMKKIVAEVNHDVENFSKEGGDRKNATEKDRFQEGADGQNIAKKDSFQEGTDEKHAAEKNGLKKDDDGKLAIKKDSFQENGSNLKEKGLEEKSFEEKSPMGRKKADDGDGGCKEDS